MELVEWFPVPREVQKKFERATRNMSVPVMVALLSRIYNRLQEDDKLDDAAAHIREAQKLPRAEHRRLFLNETVDRIDYAASADRGGQILRSVIPLLGQNSPSMAVGVYNCGASIVVRGFPLTSPGTATRRSLRGDVVP